MTPMQAPDALRQWLSSLDLGLKLDTLVVASSDAGMRQYWRIETNAGHTRIVMDAQLETQAQFDAFLKVTALMQEAGVHVPEVVAKNPESRYLVLTDLGRETFLTALNETNARAMMESAIEALVAWQKSSKPGVLPEYDLTVLDRELELFPEWYVSRHKGVQWSTEQKRWWAMTKEALLTNILAQEKVYVHRDFMPRNLMVSDPNPGVLDYQDALYGPVSYDIASLMRDAFISWSDSFTLDMTIRYWEKARAAGIPVPSDFSVFYEDVDMMSVQRHLKVLGIFARLHYRDQKPKYLVDAPRFVHYLRQTSRRYRVLSPLARLINELEGDDTVVGYTF